MKHFAAVLLAVFLATVMVLPVIAEDIGGSGSGGPDVMQDVPADITEISLGSNLPPIPLKGTYFIYQVDPDRAAAGLEKAYYTKDNDPDYDVWRVSKTKLGIRDDEEDVLLRATAILAAVSSCYPSNYEIRTAENGRRYGYFTGYEDKSQEYPGIIYLDQWYIAEDGKDIVSVVRRWKCDKINPIAGNNLQMAIPRCLTKIELTDMDYMNGIFLSYVFSDDADMPQTLKIGSFSKEVYGENKIQIYADLIESDKKYAEAAKRLAKDVWNLEDLGFFYTAFYKVQRQEITKIHGCNVMYSEVLDPVDQRSKYLMISVELDDCFVELCCTEPAGGNTYVPLALGKGVMIER